MRRNVLTVAVLGAVVAGCASASSTDPSTTLPQPAEQSAPPDTTASTGSGGGSNSQETTSTEPSVIDIPDVLDWNAPLIGGGSIDMTTLVGQQVLLWFWAPY